MPYSSRQRTSARRRTTHYAATPASRRKNTKENIHPSRFIQAARPATVVAYTPLHGFADFDVNPLLQRNLVIAGFTIPTPIQDQSIPHGLNGRDIVGIANTGTGKTLAFALPLLNKLMHDRNARALIMAPTRELAQQIQEECKMLARGSGLSGALLIGGSAMGPQLNDLKYNPQIVIGTPGRIKDHLERNSLKLDNFSVIVLDEVDRMMDMGFLPDMRHILGRIPDARQSYFYSATMNSKIQSLILSFSADPVTVSVKTGETSDNVEQNIIFAPTDKKLDHLHDLLITDGVSKTLIFHETKRSVERLSKDLESRGFAVDALHGGKTQGQRQRALDRFKRSEITVLVATDVAARGLDVADISHVINYTQPQSYVDYVHRIGRAGRAGRTGQAVTFVDRPI